MGKAYYLVGGAFLTQSLFHLETAIEYNNAPDDTYDFLSNAYLDYGEIDQAIAILRQAITQSPQFSYFISLIDIYLDLQNIEDASLLITQVEPFINSKIEQRTINIRAARIDIISNNYSTAELRFFDILEEYPESYEARYYLGELYEQQGEIGKARFEWRQSYKLNPHWEKTLTKLDQVIDF